jgi:hypothetical protein
MTLGKKQEKFSYMFLDLLTWFKYHGYQVRLGDLYAKTGHKKNSLHYLKLAGDINLFKNGVYLTETSDHQAAGEFWESIGGSWGGRFRKKDGNHYSLEHNGRR